MKAAESSLSKYRARRARMKPPKRWIPPTDEQMRRIFGPKWRPKDRLYYLPPPAQTEAEERQSEAVAREIREHGWQVIGEPR